MSFDELTELSRWAAAREAVDLGPVISLWKMAIALGAMTEAEACAEWTRIMEEPMAESAGKAGEAEEN